MKNEKNKEIIRRNNCLQNLNAQKFNNSNNNNNIFNHNDFDIFSS